MEKFKAEAIFRDHNICRDPEDPRTVEEIAEQIILTGSPKPEIVKQLGRSVITDNFPRINKFEL